MALTFKKKKLNEDLTLQITSMADIFMILLVFLLKNYSTNLATISPTEGTRLPVSAESQGTIKEALKVEVSKDFITMDQKQIVGLKNFQAEKTAGDESFIQPLFEAMQAER